MSKKTLLYIITAIFSLLFIIGSFIESVSFDSKCIFLNLENWKNVLLSLGTGLLSSVVLSFFIDLIEKRKAKDTFLSFIASIKHSIFILYGKCFQLLQDILPDLTIKHSGTFLEITKELKNALDQMKVYISPVSTSDTGIASHDSLIVQKKQIAAKKMLTENQYFKTCDARFALLMDEIEADKLKLMEKYITETQYKEIVGFLGSFANTSKLSTSGITFYDNINDIIRIIENTTILKTIDLIGEFKYEDYVFYKVGDKRLNGKKK